jgi:O-antigen ligase
MNYLILAIYFFGFGAIAWKNLSWAMVILMALLPSYLIRFKIWVLPSTLLEGMLLIIIIVWLIQEGWPRIRKRLKKEISYQPYPFTLQIILLMLAATLASWLSPNSWPALGLWRAYFLEPILFFLVFINVIKSKEKLERIFWALGISALAVSLVAIWQKFSPVGINFFGHYLWPIPKLFWQEAISRRVTSFFEYPNAVGLFLGPIVILFFGWLVATLKKLKLNLFQVAVILFSGLAIFWAQSEAVLLSLCLAIILFGLFFNKRGRILTSLILVLILIAIVLTPAKNYLVGKLTLQDFSGQVRLQIWQETLAMLKDNPLFGAGLAGYQTKILPYHESGRIINGKFQPIEIYLYPHNIFLNFWSELGFLGLLAFFWLFYEYFKKSIKLWRESKNYYCRTLALTLTLVLLTIIIHGLVDVPYFKNDLAVMFWFFVSTLIILEGLKQDENKSA